MSCFYLYVNCNCSEVWYCYCSLILSPFVMSCDVMWWVWLQNECWPKWKWKWNLWLCCKLLSQIQVWTWNLREENVLGIVRTVSGCTVWHLHVPAHLDTPEIDLINQMLRHWPISPARRRKFTCTSDRCFLIMHTLKLAGLKQFPGAC